MKTKKQVVDKIQILEGITLQMYRLLDSLEKTGAIDGQLAPLVEMAMKDYMKYIQEQV
jgi:hypothetical protein